MPPCSLARRPLPCQLALELWDYGARMDREILLGYARCRKLLVERSPLQRLAVAVNKPEHQESRVSAL